MSVLQIRLFGDPVLRQKARDVTDFDDRLARLAADMHETMREAAGVGLAANQVGVLKRLFTWRFVEDEQDHRGTVVNPVVLETSEEIQEGDEGCLSFPGLYYPLDRPLRARIRHQDLHGDEHTTDLEGLLARVFLHEIDHLNGILFIDHLARHDRKEAMRQMRELRDEADAAKAEPRSGFLLGRRSTPREL